MGFSIIYITNPSADAARKLALHLLKKKLCACVNIFPVHSAYWWKNKIQKTHEWIVVLKTISRNYKKIEKEIRKNHPYKVPCIIKISASANKDFEKWVKREIK